jgi:HSP20 family protein
MRDLNRFFDNLGRRLDTLFDGIEATFDEIPTLPPAGNYRIEKGEGQVTIRVEVPGCSSEDVQVGLADGIITVTAKAPLLGAGATQVHQFRVGRKVDVGDITAKVTNGLLTLAAKADNQPAPPQGSVTVSQG